MTNPPLTDANMKGYLAAHGSTARITVEKELWYHHSWQFGLPLGMAYMEMQVVVRRQLKREQEIRILRAAGYRFSKVRRGWFHQSKKHSEPLTRREAMEVVENANSQSRI